MIALKLLKYNIIRKRYNMKTSEFSTLVKELKESKKFNVQSLKDCTKTQLMKLEDILIDMELSKSLEKTLDIITDMLLNPTSAVANKKEVKDEIQEPKKTVKAPNKPNKESENTLTGLEYESLKIGDIITIYNPSIIDTHTRIIYKDANLIVTLDIEDSITYELKREFIVDGGYIFKNKRYYLKLSK